MIDEFTLEISQQAPDSIAIQLSESQGARIREVILQTNPSFKNYLKSVGIQTSNAYAYLSGQQKISLKVLQRLLSGTDVRITCNLDLYLEKPSGEFVPDVDCTELEDSLYLDETEESGNQQTTDSDFSFLERDLENKKITQDNPSSENQDGS